MATLKLVHSTFLNYLITIVMQVYFVVLMVLDIDIIQTFPIFYTHRLHFDEATAINYSSKLSHNQTPCLFLQVLEHVDRE